MERREENVEVLWTWLHLSDIHFGHGSKAYVPHQQDLIRQIVKDVSQVITTSDIPAPQAIIVTGDIAYSGGILRGAREYAEAEDLVSDLRKAIGLSSPVFTVPGNHDVQRTQPTERNAWRMLHALRDSNDSYNLDEAIAETADGGDASILKQRFSNYADFCSRIGSPSASGPEGFWTHRVDISADTRIVLVGFNTAVLSNDDSDFGKLNVSHATTTAAAADIQPTDLVILLTHHPISWLDQSDINHVNQKLRRDIHIHMHGHIHGADTQRVRYGTGETLITVTAGAVHADEFESEAGTPNTYSLGSVVRHPDGALSMRLWPRRWSDGRGIWLQDTEQLPSSTSFIEHGLRRAHLAAPTQPVALPAQPSNGEGDAVRRAASELIGRVGCKRTAFPTDMSIAELHDADLVIPTNFAPNSVRSDDGLLTVADVIPSRLGESILLLGAPGAGKTVLVYEFSRAILENTTKLPIYVDIVSGDLADLRPGTLLQALGVEPSVENAKVLLELGIIVVDGVDEALSSGVHPETIAARLAELRNLCPIVVSCRQHDFDFVLSAYTKDDLFDEIWVVRDWRMEQFSEFVARLQNANLLEGFVVTDRVASDPALQMLVRRPLLARMLTFLADQGNLPNDQTSLYDEYMTRLSLVTDSRVRAVGCSDVPEALQLWQKLSWFIFSLQLNPDKIAPPVLAKLADDSGTSEKCLTRALLGVLDFRNSNSTGFIHYSFFEFLTAQHIINGLIRNIPENPEAAIPLLRRHLSIEIRHFIVALLKDSGVDLSEWPRYLEIVYRSAAKESEPASLIVRNSIAYLVCRLDVPAHNALHDLLKDEQNPFLRNSLLWALTQQNNWDALKIYIDELSMNDVLANYNRGYLLFYYGDMPSVDPPHIDIAPFVDWSRTRAALNEKYDGKAYDAVSPARKAIDTYTFCDIAAVRGDRLSDHEAARFESVLQWLVSSNMTDSVIRHIRRRLADAKPAL